MEPCKTCTRTGNRAVLRLGTRPFTLWQKETTTSSRCEIWWHLGRTPNVHFSGAAMGGRTVELRVRAHHSRQRSVEEAWMCRAKLSGHRPRACPSRARVVCGREGVACERHTVQGKGGVMRPGFAQKAVGDIRRDVPGGNVFAAIFGVDSEHARTESRGDGRGGRAGDGCHSDGCRCYGCHKQRHKPIAVAPIARPP